MTATPGARPRPPAGSEPVAMRQIRTARTATAIHYLHGRETGEPVILLHGNLSASAFMLPLARALPGRYRPIAVDLRGFGASDPEPVDATRGMRDFSDDVLALLDALEVHRTHLVGWSLGGGVAMRAAIDAPGRITSLTLLAPISPYGFGGTIDTSGTLLAPDGAGSGAGSVSRSLVAALVDGDRGDDRPTSPRRLLRSFFVGPDWDRDGEDDLVAAMLTTVVGPENYPGDRADSPHWPGVAPGTTGVMNAMSPRYCSLAALATLPAGGTAPPILWARGAQDIVISDRSAMDLATRGASGSIPGWPGPDAAPPQPMLAQTRAVLDAYAAAGGAYREYVLPGVGHAPHLQALPQLLEALIPHLDGADLP